MEALESATADGFTDFTYLSHDPTLAPLHGRPRYQELIGRKEEIQPSCRRRMAAAKLRAQLGEKYLYSVDEELKLVVAASVDPATLRSLRHDLQVQAGASGSRSLPTGPTNIIRVIVPVPC